MINSSTFQYQREKIVPDEKEVNEQMPLFIACVIFRAEWNGWLGGICLFQGIFSPSFLLSSVDRKLFKDKRNIIPVTPPNVHPLFQTAAAVHTNSQPFHDSCSWFQMEMSVFKSIVVHWWQVHVALLFKENVIHCCAFRYYKCAAE